MLNFTDKYILEKLNPQSKNVLVRICYGSFSLIAMSKMTNSYITFCRNLYNWFDKISKKKPVSVFGGFFGLYFQYWIRIREDQINFE